MRTRIYATPAVKGLNDVISTTCVHSWRLHQFILLQRAGILHIFILMFAWKVRRRHDRFIETSCWWRQMVLIDFPQEEQIGSSIECLPSTFERATIKDVIDRPIAPIDAVCYRTPEQQPDFTFYNVSLHVGLYTRQKYKLSLLMAQTKL